MIERWLGPGSQAGGDGGAHMTFLGTLAAFGGGIFGAAIGGLPAFQVVGFFVIIGSVAHITTGAETFYGVPFGVLGPHVGGFASGVAAVAYAASKKKIDSGRNIVAGLMGLGSPDVLLVGGVFGILGYGVQWGLAKIPGFGAAYAWTDTVALTVVISAIVARLLFGKTGLFGTPAEGVKRYSPPSATRWVPYQSSAGQLAIIGLGVGLLAGYLAITFGAAGVFLSFGLAAASLIFLQFGVQIPVTHHIALPAAIAAAVSGSLIWGGVFGIACAFVGEFMACTFLVHGDTHIDPPAATIAPMTTLANLLAALGFFSLLPLP